MADAGFTEQNGLKMEYEVLRQEVLRRIEFRSQVALATLTIAGVTFGFGINNPAIALLFPAIALFLAASWIQHDARLREITTYIRENIEGKLPGLGWEAYRQQRAKRSTRLGGLRLSVLSAGGIFVASQLIAILIGLSKASTFTLFEWVLCAIAVVVTALTLALFRKERQTSKP